MTTLIWRHNEELVHYLNPQCVIVEFIQNSYVIPVLMQTHKILTFSLSWNWSSVLSNTKIPCPSRSYGFDRIIFYHFIYTSSIAIIIIIIRLESGLVGNNSNESLLHSTNICRCKNLQLLILTYTQQWTSKSWWKTRERDRWWNWKVIPLIVRQQQNSKVFQLHGWMNKWMDGMLCQWGFSEREFSRVHLKYLFNSAWNESLNYIRRMKWIE